jgi:hypothetical protein
MENIWVCKIGGRIDELPGGQDAPMRQAVNAAFTVITGLEAEFCFSGWSGTLTEGERACVENREPDITKTALMPQDAKALLAAIMGDHFDNDDLNSALHKLEWIIEDGGGN